MTQKEVQTNKMPQLVHAIGALLYTLHFVLNFLLNPAVKYTYILILIFTLSVLLFSNLKEALIYIIPFSLIEGQGRILWGYATFARLAFDMILFIGVTKSFAINKKLLDLKMIPKPTALIFLLHLLWWLVSLFNPQGAGVFASFATSKYYIFPFILFFALSMNQFDFTKGISNRFIALVISILIVECLLCIFQASQGRSSLGEMSSNYLSLFKKFEEFAGERFRPWGTSYSPGGMSTYIYLCSPFIFLIRWKELSRNLRIIFFSMVVIFIVLAGWTLVLSEVRAAMVKFVFILSAGLAASTYGSKLRFQSFIRLKFFALSLFLVAGVFSIFSGNLKDESLGLNKLQRLQSLGSLETFTRERSSGSVVLHHLENRVPWPMGYGPGMTTSLLPEFEKTRQSHIHYRPENYWSSDNLLIFLFLELGIGALFYISLLISTPLFLIVMALRLRKWNKISSFKVVGASLAAVLGITIGNWGAVGVPFNPESFFYWFWVSCGFVHYYHGKKEMVKLADESKVHIAGELRGH